VLLLVSMRMSAVVAMKLPLKEFILIFLLNCISMLLCDFDPTIGTKCVVSGHVSDCGGNV